MNYEKYHWPDCARPDIVAKLSTRGYVYYCINTPIDAPIAGILTNYGSCK